MQKKKKGGKKDRHIAHKPPKKRGGKREGYLTGFLGWN